MLSLSQLLTMSEEQLFGALAQHADAYIGNGFVWWSRKASVLGTAHLDVATPEHTWSTFWTEDTDHGDFIKTPALDGRLGVYALMVLYERYHIDALFTTEEEVCFSTARMFRPKPYHQWAFTMNAPSPLLWQPTCAVPVQVDNALVRALEAAGYRVGVDGYSDMVELYKQGLFGVNVGVGYRAQHTKNCSVYWDDFELSLRTFSEFLSQHLTTQLRGEGQSCQTNES